MYEEYWGLKRKPFENLPDPQFFYYAQRHEEALSRMLYVIRERKGAALLTGEYGSGKTLLSRVLIEELSTDKYQTALIFNPMLPPLEFIKEIIYQLGGEVSASLTKTDLMHKLNDILYRNSVEGRNTVVVVDEAQAIEEEKTFEELRLLLNFQLNDQFLLTLIILGQPELKEKIKNLPQLRQRLAARYHLKAFSKQETKEYIIHRLKIAGAEKEIFLEKTYAEVYRFSAGIARTINNICDMALLVSCSENLDNISKNLIREAAEDLGEEPLEVAAEA